MIHHDTIIQNQHFANTLFVVSGYGGSRSTEACSRVMKSRFIMVLSMGMSEDGPKWKKVTRGSRLNLDLCINSVGWSVHRCLLFPLLFGWPEIAHN